MLTVYPSVIHVSDNFSSAIFVDARLLSLNHEGCSLTFVLRNSTHWSHRDRHYLITDCATKVRCRNRLCSQVPWSSLGLPIRSQISTTQVQVRRRVRRSKSRNNSSMLGILGYSLKHMLRYVLTTWCTFFQRRYITPTRGYRLTTRWYLSATSNVLLCNDRICAVSN